MKKQKCYTYEFKSEAAKLVLEKGQSYCATSRQLGISEGTLAGWVKAAKSVTKKVSVPGACSEADLLVEVTRLSKELSEIRMEREILKKVTAYFAKE